MANIHKYQSVKNYILTRIKNGEYQPEQRIPNESELSDMLGVSSITVCKAMAELVNEGVIYRVKGKGSFVKGTPGSPGNMHKKLTAFLLPCDVVNDSSCMKMMIGMQRYLSSAGYSLIIENSGHDHDSELLVVKRLMANHVSGMVIYSIDPEKSIDNYVFLRKNNMPFVVIDRYTKSFPADAVVCNNHDGAFSAVEYLIGLQHKRIGFVSDSFFLSSEKERLEGYRDAMELASLKTDDSLLFIDQKVDYNRLVNSVKKGNLTALFAVNDRRALELINELLDRGINIPEDVSIIGFDDYEASKLARVPLSTVRQHFDEEGYFAAKILLDNITQPRPQFNKILLGTQLVIRSSTKMSCE